VNGLAGVLYDITKGITCYPLCGQLCERVVVIVSSVIFFQTPVSPVNAFGKVASFLFELETFVLKIS